MVILCAGIWMGLTVFCNIYVMQLQDEKKIGETAAYFIGVGSIFYSIPVAIIVTSLLEYVVGLPR